MLTLLRKEKVAPKATNEMKFLQPQAGFKVLILPTALLVIWFSFVLLLLRLYGFDLPQGVSLGLRVSELAP